ncbi:MAG: CRISPR-associated endonuclease Cas3'' [Deltaproteobacteria bacterium]|nr:CRISPR-associated endonuclease Cas3'' [Deltaproteobacteria bacterium]
MTELFYAHSKDGEPPEHWQPLEDHLRQVAERASTFAAAFKSAAWANVAGMLHDVGKAHPDFQAYLRSSAGGLDASEYDDQGTGSHPNHSGAGAIFAHEQWPNIIGKTIAYLVAGHHAGLPDWFGGRDSLPYRFVNEKGVADAIRDYAKPRLEMLPPQIRPPAFAIHCRNQDAVAYHLWVRMLFSCLVDADFLDTEAFMDPDKHARRPAFPSLQELKSRFDHQMAKMAQDTPHISINRIRADILAACRSAAEQSPGLFSLTVPTGGGKTLSGTAFAIDHAIQHNKNHIIYVIPYTSIIEQTADVLRKHFGQENVVEHHSNIAPEREKESPTLTLAAENWDAPVIVTTSVQFFESLYAAKPGRCRKLHNLVNSVVILDEAQLLPPELLYPCVEAINRLVSDYDATVVLATATQPALPNLCQTPREIIPNPPALYKKLRRTKILFPTEMNLHRDWASLAAELVGQEQVLCIVNTRPDCHALWKEMPKGTIHLSALMCGAHRSEIIADIKGRLPRGEACRAISTQLVEAGVDISFPVVYRALAGLDSINQAAGRCNRNGERPEPGTVKVFIAPKPAPPGLLRKGEDATRELESLPGFTPDRPETFHRYFEKYYSSINDTGENWWRENLVKNVNTPGPHGPDGNVQFRTAGKEFRLIKELSVPIIVRYGRNEKLIDRLRFAGPSREVMRALQRYAVNLKPKVAERLLAEGRIEEIHDGILVQADSTLYSPAIGLDIYREVYDPKDLYI